MDKRSTQISLPMNLPEKEIKDHVKQHWNITFARQGKVSIVGKRIMAMVLAQIHDNDMKLKPYYQVHVSEVVERSQMDKMSAYKQCKQALQELARQIWSIEDLGKKIFRPKQLVNTSTLENKDGFEYGYKDGMITMVLNPALEPYFIQMAHYSRYQLKYYMKFRSWYSMRLWEVLSAYRDTGTWYCPLEEFRQIVGCEKKYKDTNLMIKKTLSEPLEDLANTDLAFEFKKVYAKYHGKGRPPVVGLQFTLLKEKLTNDEILKQWADHSEEHEVILHELHDTWKISKANLVKHLPSLRIRGAKKLIRQWQIKEQSNRKIDDRGKYCNKVFCKEAGAGRTDQTGGHYE